MTDIPREPRPIPELDRGLRNGGTTWSAYLADIEARGGPVTPYRAANSQSGSNWEQLGVASDPLDFDRLGQQLDDADFTAAHDSVRPELANALQAAAEDATGATVLSLDDIAASGMVAFQRFLNAEIAKAAAEIPPGYDIAVSCDPVGNVFDSDRVAFKITGTPRAEPLTLDDIVDVYRKFGAMTPPEPVKLTREQMDALPKATPSPLHAGVVGDLFGVPVELVDTVEESTPYQWRHAKPGPLRFDCELSEEELAAIRRRWEREAATALHRKVVIAEATTAPAEHQHIWTTTSPMRCVDCRRYLRPWWRRTLDRIQRWKY